ncbi:MAG: vWA domain-containing protein [bacterium]
MSRFRYFRFDEALLRDLAEFQNVLDLFNHLLLQSDGDVDEALEMLRYLAKQGYLPDGFDVEKFAKRLEEEEYIEVSDDGARLTRKGERGIRKSALSYVFSALRKGESGDHRVPREGDGREMLSERRPWRFGDEVNNIDFRGSLLNSFRRASATGADETQVSLTGLEGTGLLGGGLKEEDLEVFETEHSSSCATALLIDISHSMVLYGEDRITPAKRVALALTELILTKYPKDTLDVIAFGDDAFEIAIGDIPYLEVGPYHTNTKAALQMARKILERRKAANRQIFLITDGKPTVIRESDGTIYRNTFGLDPKIINRTLDEAVVCRRKRIPITTFMVTRDAHFQDFVTQLTELNRGRAYFSSLNKLGEYILMDFVENRRRRVR